ncbi:MAG: hypothetical protein KME29_09540 [Calothrix sp. FI2-JRJ7]|jgi:hypothetical protein|nr:hypothetical protein [Calothrix sp. FI2-JRJ7]
MYGVQLLAEQGFLDIGNVDRLPPTFEKDHYNCAVSNGQNLPSKRAKLYPDRNSQLQTTLPVIEETSFNQKPYLGFDRAWKFCAVCLTTANGALKTPIKFT